MLSPSTIAFIAKPKTLAESLRHLITELDAANQPDDLYQAVFSTFAKKPLRPGETWRDRLVRWCESEEQYEHTHIV